MKGEFPGLTILKRILPRWRGIPKEVDDELAFHVDARVEELIKSGQSPEAARRAALTEFGDLSAARTELVTIDQRAGTRAQRAQWQSDLARDVHTAWLHLVRNRAHAIAVTVTLGLGLGANVAMFGALDEALLRPLPFRDGNRLVHLWESRAEMLGSRSEASYPDFLDWRRESHAFSSLGGYSQTRVTVREAAGADMRSATRVTAGFFSTLGVEPRLGRAFAAGEDQPGGTPVVVLTHGYWLRRFGGDPHVLDSSLTIDQAPYRVIGVLPASFRFAQVEPNDLWLPLDAGAERRAMRFNHWLNVIARLSPEASVTSAAVELNGIMAQLASAYPETNQSRQASVVPLRTEFLGAVGPAVLVAFGAGALLLLVTIGNVASLLVAKGLRRQREIQIRAAVGAGRGQLMRQLALESAFLALLGCGLGLAVAVGLRAAMATVLPSDVVERLPALRTVGVTTPSVLYALVATFVATLLFASFPVARLTRAQSGLVAGPRTTTTREGHRIRNVVVVTQLAFVTVLLGAIGLMGQSVVKLLREPLGFEPGGVLAARVAITGPEYESDAAAIRFFDRVLAQVAAIPGADRVGGVSQLPLIFGGTNSYRVEGDPEPPPASRPEATVRTVLGDYFGAMGIPVIEGRPFTAKDDSTATRAIIINASLGRRIAGSGSAVGKRLRFYAFPTAAWEVIGVVGDARTARIDEPAPSTIYFSQGQAADGRLTIVVRTRQPLDGIGDAVRQAVASVDPSVAVYDLAPMARRVATTPPLTIRRVIFAVVGLLGAVALALAVVGLFGVISGTVTERTREFGIRQALGAGPGRVRKMVVTQAAGLGLIGIALGLGLFGLSARALPSLLYRVHPIDPLTLGGVGLVLGSVVIGASYLPARRASRIDPSLTLKAE